jgi:hypothetical protein
MLNQHKVQILLGGVNAPIDDSNAALSARNDERNADRVSKG